MLEAIIRLSNIKKTYDNIEYILNGVDFQSGKGEFVVIQGKSGSGKSTLLNIIGLLDTYTSGQYFFEDRLINPQKNYPHLRANKIGFVFQSYHLIESLSVKENVLLPFLYSDSRLNSCTLTTIESILDKFNLSKFERKKVSLLSGGEKQRVAIARAIIKYPDIIIADEPTGNLDEENTSTIINAFQQLARAGNAAIIMVTHNSQIADCGTSKYLLSEGKLIRC